MYRRNPEEELGRLKEFLGELSEPVARPVFVLVSGLPGTGKTYFSRRLGERLPSVIVESDALRKVLFAHPTYRPEESQRLFTATHHLIEGLLKGGRSVIFDATNVLEQHRQHLYRIAEKLGVRLIIVHVEAPHEVVRERLEDRSVHRRPDEKSDAGWDVYSRMRSRAERIRRNYFSVDTSRDIAPVIEKIVREARR
ncbi:MAG: ATP-binding protein [Dehalococcoidia bacterium]|nr:ATP-binding protein [Dehalococcoidia bacterium]